jgi:hypothetical protein
MSGMAMQFVCVISRVEDMEIWNANRNGFSFVISYESHSGPGLRGRAGFVELWRPIYQNRCAIKVGGSPFKSFTEAWGTSRFLRATVDKWAAQQPDEPSRSEAIRRLVELGLTIRMKAKTALPRSRRPRKRTGQKSN